MTRSTNRHSGAHGRRLRLRSLGAGTILALALLALSGAASGYAATNTVAPPQNVRPPAIRGTATEGQLLRADAGRWRAATVRRAVYGYQWQVCDSAGATCTDIADATDAIYAVRHGDLARTLKVVVTATTTDGGSTRATSAPTPQSRRRRPERPPSAFVPRSAARRRWARRSPRRAAPGPVRSPSACAFAGGAVPSSAGRAATSPAWRRPTSSAVRTSVTPCACS